MTKTSNAAVRGLSALFLAAATMGGAYAVQAAPAQPAPASVSDMTVNTYEPIQIGDKPSFFIFEQAIEVLKENYINPHLQDSKMVANAIDGMAAYIAAQELKTQSDALNARMSAEIRGGATTLSPSLKAAIKKMQKKAEAIKKNFVDAMKASDPHSRRLIDNLVQVVGQQHAGQVSNLRNKIAQETADLQTKFESSVARVQANAQLSAGQKTGIIEQLTQSRDQAMARYDAVRQDLQQETPRFESSVRDGFTLEYSAMKVLAAHPALRGHEKALIEAGLNGIFTGLDPHSSFFDEAQTADNQEQSQAAFGGIGLEITVKNGAIVAGKTLSDDSPAALAHIRQGDVITKIDGVSTDGMTTSDVANKIRGKLGTQVHVEFKRPGVAAPIELTLTRSTIHTPSVTEEVLISENGKKIGYITMRDFMDEQIPEELQKAFRKLGDVDGYILNLRGNPGGLVGNAVATADDFLNAGTIVSEIGRNGVPQGHSNATPGDLAHGKPVTVLTDTGTASAAEIVTRALRGNNRANVVGSRSYGKGSVQSVMPFDSMIPHTRLHFTTGLYLTPHRVSIQGIGITPDIEARIPGDTYEIHESDNKNMLPNPNTPDIAVRKHPSESCTLRPTFNAAATLPDSYVVHLRNGETKVDVPLVCAVANMAGRHSAVVQFKPWTPSSHATVQHARP